MFKIMLILCVIAIVGFVVMVALRPSEFRISRSITIAAPVAVIFPLVNDFHQWDAWSPWAKLDPAAKNSFEGPSAGVGAVLRWVGNREVGEGSMALTESTPNQRIRIRLDFLKPFKATHMAEFTFTADGNNTVVSWSMFGTNDFIAKAVSLVMNCDKMVGEKFEQGLAQMKQLAEARKN